MKLNYIVIIFTLLGCTKYSKHKCIKSHTEIMYQAMLVGGGALTILPVFYTVCDKYETERVRE